MKLEWVRKEILTYCGGFPQTIMVHGPAQMGSIAIGLGNCFVWTASLLDGPGPRLEQPLNETAQSIHALGKQLRVVGLDVWDRQKLDSGTEIALLRAEVARLDKLVHRLAAERSGK